MQQMSRLPLWIVCCCLVLIPAGCSSQKQKAEALVRESGALQQRGDHSGALRLLDEAVALHPALAESHYARGVCQAGLGRHAEAVNSLKSAVSLKPSWTDAWVACGQSQKHLGDRPSAISSFSEALRLDSRHSAARYERACALIDQQDTRSALEDLDALIRNDPLHLGGRYQRAQCLWKSHPEQAIEDLDYVLNREQGNIDALVLRGMAWSHAGKPERGLADLNVVCQKAPEKFTGWLERGRILRQQQRLTEAVADLRQAVSLNDRNADALFELSHALQSIGDFSEADRLLRRTLELQPQHVAARIAAAESLMGHGAFDAAAESLQKLIRESGSAGSEPIGALNNARMSLTRCLVELKRMEEALATIQQVLQSQPRREAARILRAELLESLDRREEAVNEYSLLIARQHQDPLLLLKRARLHVASASMTAALQDLNSLLSLMPRNAEALNLRATVFETQGDAPRAIDDLTQAIRVSADPSPFYFRRGLLLESSGQYDAACADLRFVLHQASSSAEVLQAVVRILQKQGKRDDMLQVLEAAATGAPKALSSQLRLTYAALLLDRNRTSESVRQLETLTAAELESSEALLCRARAEAAFGKPDSAVTYLRSIPKEAQSPQSQCLLAASLIQMGSPAEALPILNPLIDAAPQEVELRTLRLRILAIQENWADAEDDAMFVIAQDPENIDARQVRGVLRSLRGARAEALQDLEYDTVRLRNSVTLIWHRIQCLAAAGGTEVARSELDELVEMAPEHIPARMVRATLALQSDDYRPAAEDLSAVLKLQPTNTEALVKRGLLLMRVSRTQSAVADLTLALQINPELADAWLYRGQARHQMRQFAAAIEDLKHCLELRPEDPLAMALMARIAADDNRPADSVRLYDALLQRYPGNSVAWYNRGIVLYQLKRIEEAVRSWTQTLEIQPRESRALSNRAAALVLLKRHQEAAADYQRLVQLTPDNPAAWQNYASLLISSEQPDVRNTELALHAAEQACKLSDYEDWKHLNSLAKAHEAAGNLQQARTWAEKARAIAPSSFRAAPELLVRSLDARLKNQQNSSPSPVAGPNSSRRLRAATGGRSAAGN